MMLFFGFAISDSHNYIIRVFKNLKEFQCIIIIASNSETVRGQKQELWHSTAHTIQSKYLYIHTGDGYSTSN